MNVVLVKSRAGTYVPATEEDRTKLRAVKPGEAFRVKVGRPRNIGHHRKMMACVSFVAERHPDYRSIPETAYGGPFEALIETLKLVTGHFFEWTTPSTGEVNRRTRSIAFDELDEGEFIAWTTKAKPYLVELMEQFTERTKHRHADEIDGWVHWCLH